MTRSNVGAWQEAKLMLNLVLPTIFIQLGSVLPGFWTASLIGREFGPVYLDGFTLANLMGNLCNLTLLQGLYTSSDTLSPRAYSTGNHKEVGLIAIRGYVASLAMLIPVNVILWFFFGPIMVGVGEDPEASDEAHSWYQVYSLGFPFYALYMVTWKFLSAQEIMRPLVIVSIICCFVILPIALNFGTRYFGYLGSAAGITIFQMAQPALLLLYLRLFHPHTPGTWPGLSSWRDAMHRDLFKEYFMLGLGGILATSEWVYWESLSLMIGTFGVVSLGVHTVPTQVNMVGFMVPLGIGIALSVRMGAILPYDVRRTKQLVIWTFIFSTALFIILSGAMYAGREYIFSIFTDDEEVLAGCERIWWKVVVFFFNLSVYGINMGVATGLGLQWFFGLTTIFFLWIVSMPSMFYFAVHLGGGLGAAWSCIWPPYSAMNLFLIYTFYTKDWDEVHRQIREKERSNESGHVNEKTKLVRRKSPLETIKENI